MLDSLNMKNIPHWPNLCDHAISDYVGSVSTWHRTQDKKLYEQWWDVYVYEDDSVPGDSGICIRQGKDPADYYGSHISYFLQSVQEDNMHKVLELLRLKGSFSWQKD